ncbi:hypothetical protein ACFQ44_05085 [Levilactobacillus lanxiensis]|uniref:Uncharacterized protein n=1 Tax=Levilactobacillus lanxiensis TaxID=2799568 RepID=A0ABW4D4K3_9LACO|nr:hypothetical protein [Levilactobacillus lanxiensis]
MWKLHWQLIWGFIAFLAIILTVNLKNTSWLKIGIWVVVILLGLAIAVKNRKS